MDDSDLSDAEMSTEENDIPKEQVVEKILARLKHDVKNVGLNPSKGFRCFICVLDQIVDSGLTYVRYTFDNHVAECNMIEALLAMPKQDFESFIGVCETKYNKLKKKYNKSYEKTPGLLEFGLKVAKFHNVNIPVNDSGLDYIFSTQLYDIMDKYLGKTPSGNIAMLALMGREDCVGCYTFCINSKITLKSSTKTDFVFTIENTRLENKNCFVCGAFTKCSVCSQCKLVRYCSPECQRIAWNAYHKQTCKYLC